MKESFFEAEVWLPRAREEVFAFFCDAMNLDALTPSWLNFQVLTPPPIEMRKGAIIDYRIRVHGIPVRWRTEICDWQPPACFVDVQLRGPYRLWHHTHLFEPVNGGTMCKDVVRYCPRGGRLLDWLFVRRDVRKIFDYRRKTMQRLFVSNGVLAPDNLRN